jgi:hypothetical protein
MSGLNQSNMHSLECLRFEADCRELAKNARNPEVHSHYLRMAEVWMVLAVSGTNSRPGEGISEAETQMP